MLLCAVIACEDPIDPFVGFTQQRVLIHGILDLSADTQKVLIETTDGASNFLVSNATVQVTTPSGQVIPLQVRPFTGGTELTVYFFRATTNPLQPGGKYQLSVAIPGRPAISGSTTIPAFTGAAPTEQLPPFSKRADTLRLELPSVASAAGYELVFNYPLALGGEENFFERKSVFTTASVALAGNARTVTGNDLFLPGFRAVVTAAAVDDNYRTYYRMGADPFAGAPPSRLTNALGVFGSIAPVRRYAFDVR